MRYPDYEFSEQEFLRTFPALPFMRETITSNEDPNFNCIAFAAEDAEHWWWPTRFWPIDRREETVACFIEAFATLGYTPCKHGRLEYGHQKVVIYANARNAPTHRAKQQPDGNRKSKCGSAQDIQHSTPEELHSELYGQVHTFLKRTDPTTSRQSLKQQYLRLRSWIAQIWK